MKLKAPNQIKDIFDQYPRHLKSTYNLKVHIDESETHKHVLQFKRSDFTYLNRVNRLFKTYTISKERHCTLELRRNQKFKPQMRETFIPTAQFVQSEIFWDTEIEETVANPIAIQSNEIKLYMVASGRGGMIVKRYGNEQKYIEYEQSCELQERDQIILLSEGSEPQISYVVQRIFIKQL